MNTEKINCDITKDLLPLYVDDVLSRESKNAVEENLQHCPQCRKIAEGLTPPCRMFKLYRILKITFSYKCKKSSGNYH